MSYLYEDLEDKAVFETARRTITETDIVNFAGLSGDFNPLHVDAEFTRTTRFGQRIAHGALVFSIGTGLLASLGLFDGTVIAFTGVDSWSFRKPVVIGDTVHLQMTVEKRRITSDGRRGIIDRHCRILNQRDEVVQEGVWSAMIKTRSHEVSSEGPTK